MHLEPVERSTTTVTSWPTLREWWGALRWVAATFTLLVILTLAGSFVSYEQVVRRGHPWLPRRRCAGCSFCGMTRSFCALSHGRVEEARRWNRLGPPLYAAGWVWLAVACSLTLGAARRKAARFGAYGPQPGSRRTRISP